MIRSPLSGTLSSLSGIAITALSTLALSSREGTPPVARGDAVLDVYALALGSLR